MDDHLKEYRNQIVELRQKAIEQYEKTLLTLSTGALALSVVFVKDIFKGNLESTSSFLHLAWACWILSVTLSLISFFISQLAYSKALSQIDDDLIYKEKPGGKYTGMIFRLNTLNGLVFLLGMIFISLVGVGRT